MRVGSFSLCCITIYLFLIKLACMSANQNSVCCWTYSKIVCKRDFAKGKLSIQTSGLSQAIAI